MEDRSSRRMRTLVVQTARERSGLRFRRQVELDKICRKMFPLRVPSRAIHEPQRRLHEARRCARGHTRLEGFAYARCGATHARQNW